MLSELQVKNVRPKEKNFMLWDDRGLYLTPVTVVLLIVTPENGK